MLLFSQVVASPSNHSVHSFDAAYKLCNEGRYSESLELAEKISKTAQSRHERFGALKVMIESYSGMNKREEALKWLKVFIKELTKALEKETNPVEKNRLQSELGVAYVRKRNIEFYRGEFANALQSINDAISFSSATPALLQERADVYFSLHRYTEAISDETKVIKALTNLHGMHLHKDMMKTDSALVKALYSRSKLYKLVGKSDLAEQDFQRANQLTDNL